MKKLFKKNVTIDYFTFKPHKADIEIIFDKWNLKSSKTYL